MDQSPTARLAPAHASDGVHGRATHIGRVGEISFGFLVCPGAGGGGEKFLPTCVLCHGSSAGSVLRGQTRASRVYLRIYRTYLFGERYSYYMLTPLLPFALPDCVVEHVSTADSALLIEAR